MRGMALVWIVAAVMLTGCASGWPTAQTRALPQIQGSLPANGTLLTSPAPQGNFVPQHAPAAPQPTLAPSQASGGGLFSNWNLFGGTPTPANAPTASVTPLGGSTPSNTHGWNSPPVVNDSPPPYVPTLPAVRPVDKSTSAPGNSTWSRAVSAK